MDRETDPRNLRLVQAPTGLAHAAPGGMLGLPPQFIERCLYGCSQSET